MQFSTLLTVFASVAAVSAIAAPKPLTPAQCAANNLKHCNNSNEPCPIGCFCPGGNLPEGGCCAGSC
ncbi:hypothetical protein K4K56_004867 [Colletotrichum sp. SAR 10_98]|nr:hypothetical protein K4K56_004867 [Colletotrichum sp. SAR 10_98]